MLPARSRVAVTALGAGLAVVGLAALGLRCGGADIEGQSGDADVGAPDSGAEVIASDSPEEEHWDTAMPDMDTEPPCFTGDASSWAGWRRLETPYCCELAVPESLSTVLHDLTWKPCPDTSGCEMVDPSSMGITDPSLLFLAQSSRGPDGKPARLELGYRINSDTAVQEAVYDWKTLSPVAAWRSSIDGSCAIDALIGRSVTAGSPAILFEVTYSMGRDKWFAAGDFSTLSTTPSFHFIPGSEVPFEQDVVASGTTLAFDLALGGRILRTPLDSGTYVLSPKTGFPSFLADFVEKDDVFALSVHGTSGYGQEWHIDPDGTPVSIRALGDRHVSTFATDGTTLFWVELYGSTSVLDTMKREVWAAPYTTDAATLSATAKKIASIPDDRVPHTAIAYDGIYAVISHSGAQTVYILRLADGVLTSVSYSAASTGFDDLVYVSNSELWVTIAGSLRRYTLGAW